MKNYSYHIKVSVMKKGNLYHAYHNDTNCLISPLKGRKTEVEARLDAKLNWKQCSATVSTMIWKDIDPVLKIGTRNSNNGE